MYTTTAELATNLTFVPAPQVMCTAGVGLQKFEQSEDGIDKHFAVTHLAHFLLINRLLPLLRRTSTSTPPDSSAASPTSAAHPPPHPPRIVNISSTLHTAASPSVLFLSYAELSAESSESSSPLALFARAALATILFTKHLALRLSPSLSQPPPGPTSLPPASPSPSPTTEYTAIQSV